MHCEQREHSQVVQVYEKISSLIDSLTSLNGEHELTTLTERKSMLSVLLEQLDELCLSLNKNFAEFSVQQNELDNQLLSVSNLISTNLTLVDEFNNVSGTDAELLERLTSAQV